MQPVIVNNLTKTYGKEKSLAVDGVTFSVGRGELFGLIGPDGAGKTSIFRMLTTLLVQDSGEASVEGFDIVRDFYPIRKTVGYMPGKFSLYPDLTIQENLHFFATIFHTTVEKNYDLIRDIFVHLEPFKTRRAGKLSGGMKQKLALCCALIHRPSVLFLDEPTTGVDPVSRKEFWEILRRLRENNITIVVSTPYMDEASLCDRIALMQNGKLLSIDTPLQITQRYPTPLFAIHAHSMPLLLRSLNKYSNTKSSYAFGEYAHASFHDPETDPVKISRYLQEDGLSDIEVKLTDPSIEDCFIHLMKK